MMKNIRKSNLISGDELPLKKKIPSMIIVFRAVFMKITNIFRKFIQMNVCISYRPRRES